MKAALIIPAAGSGQRFGRLTPKQFIKLGHEPLLVHTIKRFAGLREIKRIILVLPDDKLRFLDRFLKKYKWEGLISVTAGGHTRQDSVYNGFKCLDKLSDLVLVHDGVRPFVDRRLIHRVLKAAQKTGAAVPAIPPTDTVKMTVTNGKRLALGRENFCCIQTPQGFRSAILGAALETARKQGFYATDESSLVERLGYPVTLVPGSELNIKITRPLDFLLARAILKVAKPQVNRNLSLKPETQKSRRLVS